ncbi:glycoside hydrolase family protein [Nocardioides sp. CF8]|uniref:family 43 glycosylhydrolase n=1 Tax=Nocardioides sp. CF8 TaxID=110319 RepID=UPI00032E49B9|nr:family 43 glycosylhydrolase [Nocardioides sp. CF8]EON22421.1 glycoside hydrolase family protein [Nocardioides sp. CF8]
MTRHLTRWAGALTALAVLPALLALAPGSTSASGADDRLAAMAPRPLIWERDFGDPSVVFDGTKWFGAATGFRGRGSDSANDWGIWNPTGDLLNAKPAWAKYAGVWGPDLERGPAGWLAYYTMPSRGLPHAQDRCIGVATAPSVDETFTPVSDRPLVCPDYSATEPASDPVGGRAGLPRRGVIDPSSFIAPDGRRFLLYRTQGTPSTIRMIRLNPAGTGTFGTSRELIRDVGVLENPVMVQHGDWYYLITSRGDYGDCRYRTIWRRSHFRHKDWQGTRGHALVNRRNSGVCGPGGADYVEATTSHANRLFFHGWVCKGTNLPCYQSYQGGKDFEDVGKRALYAARLRWTKNGPVLSAFVQGPEPVPPPPSPTPTPTPTVTPTTPPPTSPTSPPPTSPTTSTTTTSPTTSPTTTSTIPIPIP